MTVHPLLAKMQEYAPTASWAVWSPAPAYDRVTDISFPTTGLEALHAKSVILGLNRGGAGHALKPWQIFHTGPKHNDHFLAEAFRDTPHWGCYMTDLLAEVNSDSSTLNMSASQLRDDVADLIAELQLLGVNDPLFILLGQKTGRAFAQHESVLAPALGLEKLRRVEVPHYSAANGKVHGNRPHTYRSIVHEALAGIVADAHSASQVP